MFFEFTNLDLGSIIGLTSHYQNDQNRFTITENQVCLLWNKNQANVEFKIDNVPFELKPNQILSLTFLQHTEFEETSLGLHAIIFNREFYCILDHDEEVSCNGILFFGTQDIPIISLNDKEEHSFNLLLQVFEDEFQNKDKIQGEMLQMLLKRFIIKCVRLAKDQLISKKLENHQLEVIRKFNFLVDLHYRNMRLVKDYAKLLHKSPKTLSNLFAIYNQRSPQQIIIDRIMLEAKRQLYFTDRSINEIGFDLGYEDPAYFSRLFKKQSGKSPSDFKLGTSA